MTLTIEIAPETESRLAAKAGEQGLSLSEYARRLLEQEAAGATNGHGVNGNGHGVAPPVETASAKPDRATRQAATRALRGRLAGRVSSEQLIRERREEASREMQATAAWLELTAAKLASGLCSIPVR